MYFDTHSHFHDDKFLPDFADTLARAHAAGVTRILTLGDSIAASRKAIALASQHPSVHAAAGIHPSNARSWCDETREDLLLLLQQPQVVVLGEIGLDYYWDKSEDFVRQQHCCFREQLQIAKATGFPVSIHSRESNRDVLQALEEEDGASIGGVLHCFNGTYEEARRGLDLGFLIGVGGTATYPKSADLREVLIKVGLDHIVIETDAPYLPPQPMRGKRNEPAFVALTAKHLAALFGIEPNALGERTHQNGLRAFRWDSPRRRPTQNHQEPTSNAG
jgi:TatD DNase family protein